MPLSETEFQLLSIVEDAKKFTLAGPDIVKISDGLIGRGHVHAIVASLLAQYFLERKDEEEPRYRLPRQVLAVTPSGKKILSICKEIRNRHAKESYLEGAVFA